jgi:signal transduction histidine kinase/DNA-binding response OmpR family regulator
MGGTFAELERFDDAYKALQVALEIFEMFKFDYGISLVENKLAEIFIRQKNWQEALIHANKAFEIAQESQLKQTLNGISRKLYIIYKETNQFEKSLEMLELHTQLKDSLGSEANTKALLEQRLQYEYEQQAQLDSVQNAAVLSVQLEENKRRRNTSYYLLGGLILTGIFAFLLYNRFRITQRQRNQLDAANEQLKELDQSKSRFFTNISHEFRTPLTIISGMADMVNDSEPRELIKRNSQSLLGLVNQILDLRKLEAGKLPIHMVQGNVIPFLQYLLESFQSYAESKGINLSFSTDTREVIMDYDPEKLHSIVTNLISNAIKFTESGGEVKMKVSDSQFPFQLAGTRVMNQEPETSNELSITVSDSGKGIPKEKLPKIFDRFYQVDDSITRQGEGTGIGLTLTRELVKVLDGKITVQSEEGKGTVFKLLLPITNQASMADAATPVSENTRLTTIVEVAEEIPAGSSDAFKLLIVEDNSDVVRYLQASLKEAYQISIARDGQEGIEKAIAEVPDIIISDVMMPRKDGFELCQTLKTDERTSHIPIILLTAKADVESRISGLQRGADAYLAKPFEKAELMVRLEMLIKLRQQLQARYQNLDQSSPAEDEATQIEDAFIQKLNEQIFEHISDSSIDVQRLCEWTGMSRTQFHHKIKALTGRSASNYLRFVRLREAKKHLETSEKSISEIAYDLGFNDPAYFSRSFVKEFGLAPSESRK